MGITGGLTLLGQPFAFENAAKMRARSPGEKSSLDHDTNPGLTRVTSEQEMLTELTPGVRRG